MVGTGKTRFEVAQHGVDPPELGQIPGLAATGDDRRMRTSGIGYSVKIREAISQDLTVRIERAVRPAFYGSTGKSLGVADTKLAFQRQRRQSRFGLAKSDIVPETRWSGASGYLERGFRQSGKSGDDNGCTETPGHTLLTKQKPRW